MNKPKKKPTLIQWEPDDHAKVKAKADQATMDFVSFVRAAALGLPVINRRSLGVEDRKLMARAISRLNTVGNALGRMADSLEIEGNIPLPREFFDLLGATSDAADAVQYVLAKLQATSEQAMNEVPPR